MFQRIQEYQPIAMGPQWYRPRAYGDEQPDGTWDGWLVFFPIGGGLPIAPDRETTQSRFELLAAWASRLTPVYLEGALARAMRIARQPSFMPQLATAEEEALEDAERLEAVAELEHISARADEAAAAEARVDAELIRRERIARESALAATEEAAARLEAEVHENAARTARAVAADAGSRRRSAEAKATRAARPKRRNPKTRT
jgi:hypothetical protein